MKVNYLCQYKGGAIVTASGTIKDEEVDFILGSKTKNGRYGLAIRGVDLENSVILVTAKTYTYMLGRKEFTAEVNLDNSDILFKHKIYALVGAAAGNTEDPFTRSFDFNPPIPFYGTKLHIGILQDSGAALTVYYKLRHSAAWFSENELSQIVEQYILNA